MKRTRKYVAGIARLRELENKKTGRMKRYENDELYRLLDSRKQIWDSNLGKWVQGSKSMFGDDEPTGIVCIRVMAHPQDVHDAIHYLKGTNLKISDVSEEYPNRRGSGVRVYITASL